MIATSQDMVQSEPHSHTEYVNLEPSQHIGINKLEDFHIVRADKSVGINWKWQSMDGAITKAPLGGKKYRTKPNRQK